MFNFNIKLFFSLILAIAPPAIIVRYFYLKLESKNQQKKLIYTLYFLGIVLTIPILSLEFLLGRIESSFSFSILTNQLLKSFIIVGLCEELSKGVIVIVFAYKKIEFNRFMNGVIYAIIVSMGLATLENVLYLLRGGIGLAILRTFTAVPLHVLSAGILGYYISKARFSKFRPERQKLLLRGLFYASVIHGLYDFLLSSTSELLIYASIGVYLLLVLIFIILKNKIKSARRKDGILKQLKLLNEPVY